MVAYLLIALLLCLGAFLWHLKRRNDYFKALDIDGPKPVLLFGNLLSVVGEPMHRVMAQWTSKYGKTFGCMEGGTPVLVTSDVDLLHEVFVKRFSHFHSRKALPIGPDPDTAKNVHMFVARGQRWKRLRTICNPTFSSAKLKAMTPSVDEAVSLFVSILEKKCQQQKPFNICPMYQALTLEVIGRCAFGLQVDCQRNPDDEFLTMCKHIFDNTIKLTWIRLCGILFPEYPRLWWGIHTVRDAIFGGNPFVNLTKKLQNVVDQRRSLSYESIDLLQLLLDSEVDEELELENNLNEQTLTRKKLLPEEVISTCILFLLAGYETTSTALSYATYLLALNPRVQKKLQKEIDAMNDEPGYDSINKCSYLDYVVSETLRLYPIASSNIIARKCMENCQIGDIFLPAGLVVTPDVWTIHHSEQVWGDDVEEFRPERFSPEESRGRHPMAWLPFGAGPRNCLGMRFALMEAKLTLFNVLKRFSFLTCPETEIPLKLQEGATITPLNGITVLCEKRNSIK